jgi:hypothetical protein
MEPPGGAFGVQAPGVAHEDLQPALVGVLGVVGAQAVAPRRPQQRVGVCGDQLKDEALGLLRRPLRRGGELLPGTAGLTVAGGVNRTCDLDRGDVGPPDCDVFHDFLLELFSLCEGAHRQNSPPPWGLYGPFSRCLRDFGGRVLEAPERAARRQTG